MPNLRRQTTPAAQRGGAAMVTITVARQPEGVWLATSDDLPNLICETKTRDAAIDLAPEIVRELMELDGDPRLPTLEFRFRFQP
jgi:hypothetical protein